MMIGRRNLAIDVIAVIFVLLLGLWAWGKIETPASTSPALAERWGYYCFSDYSTMLGGKRFYEEGFAQNYFLAAQTVGYKEFARSLHYYQVPQIVPNSAIYYTHHGSLDSIINGLLRHIGLTQLTDFYKVAAFLSLLGLLFWYGAAVQLFRRPVALVSLLFIGTAYPFTRTMETIAYYSYDLFWVFGAIFLFILADRSRFKGRRIGMLLLFGAWLFTFLQSRNSLEWILFLQIFFIGYYLVFYGRAARSKWRHMLFFLSAPILGFAIHFGQVAWCLGGIDNAFTDFKAAFLRRTVEFELAEEVGFRHYTIGEGIRYITPFLLNRLMLVWVVALSALAIPAVIAKFRSSDDVGKQDILRQLKLILLFGVAGVAYLIPFFQNTVTTIPYIIRILLPFLALLFAFSSVALVRLAYRLVSSKWKLAVRLSCLILLLLALVPVVTIAKERVEKFDMSYHMFAYPDDGTNVGRWDFEYLGRHPNQIVALAEYIEENTSYGDIIITDIDTGETGHPRYPHAAYEYLSNRRFEKFQGLEDFLARFDDLGEIRSTLPEDNPAKNVKFYLLVEDAKSDGNVLGYVNDLGISPTHFSLTTAGPTPSLREPRADIVNGSKVYHRVLSWQFGPDGTANVLPRGTNLTNDAEMFMIPDSDLVYILKHGQRFIRPLGNGYGLTDKDFYDVVGYINQVLRGGYTPQGLTISYTLYELEHL